MPSNLMNPYFESLRRSNALLRSVFEVATRHGAGVDWERLRRDVHAELVEQDKFQFQEPDGYHDDITISQDPQLKIDWSTMLSSEAIRQGMPVDVEGLTVLDSKFGHCNGCGDHTRRSCEAMGCCALQNLAALAVVQAGAVSNVTPPQAALREKPELEDFHLESRPCPRCGVTMLYDEGEPWDGPTWNCSNCENQESASGLSPPAEKDAEIARLRDFEAWATRLERAVLELEAERGTLQVRVKELEEALEMLAPAKPTDGASNG